MSLNYLEDGPQMFADKLERGFPGGVIYIGGLYKLRMEIDALDVSAQRKNSLLAFAARYAALGYEGMQTAYSRATFYRQRKQFQEHGLCLDDITHFHGEVDFNPIIRCLKAA
jgi:II/X family phage/plasmid replication protein